MEVPRLISLSVPIVTLFGSARPAPGDADYDLAYQLGREIAKSGCCLCNGGYAGIMEASARGAAEAVKPRQNGEPRTIGVTCRIFADRLVNRWIDRELPTGSLMDRLLTLIDCGDAYVLLRGGTGTLLEFAAVWEMTNKRMITQKPIIVLGGFWDPIVERVTEQLVREGLAGRPANMFRAGSARECVDILLSQLKGKHLGV